MTLQRKSSRHRSSSLLALLVAGGLGLAAMAQADTPVSVTEISYDANLRPLCAAIRMNPANFGTAPADACTAQTAGSFGPDRITKTIYDVASQVREIDKGVGSGAGFLNQKYARYTYSGNGLKTSETDANGNKTILIYDGFDRLSQMQYPSTTVGSGGVNTADYETFGYDNNSNRTSWRRRNGYTIGYGFDNLNREIVQDVPASPGNTNGTDKDMSTGYDLQGHIKTKTFGNGLTVSYTYDALGRVTAASDVANRINFYQYNQTSARIYLTMPDGNWVNYGLDNTNRLVSINHNSAGILFTQAYDNLGRRVSLGRGSGNAGGATTYGYDNLNRLTALTNDIAGTANDITWTFSSYNPASQVMTWGTSSILFDYKELSSTTDNRTYNGLNQDASIAVLSGGYDANANLANDGTRAMTYDIYNRLLTVSGGGANLQLDYDPEGRLYKYTSNGTTTYFSYDGTNLIGEYSALATLRQYIHGTGTDEPVVWFEGSGTADRRYLYQNYQGSVIAYTDASGNLSTANLYKYGPWGEPKNASDAESWSGARFRYTGQTIIPEAKLYYYKARVYDPAMGRFLQTDPVGSKDDLDLYAYVGGDPINRADPDGTEFTFIGGAGVQGDYLKGFQSAFSDAGIQNVNVPEGQPGNATLAGDVLGVTSVNDLKFANSLVGTQTINDLAAHSNSMPDGEQFNLGGYSYGSAAAASAAYAIAQSGGHVDNLVLVGAPINKDLMDAVTSNPNIKNVINIDLSSHGDPIRAGMNDWQIAGTLPTLVGQMKDNAGHFYYSGTGATADDRRKALANELVKRGVR